MLREVTWQSEVVTDLIPYDAARTFLRKETLERSRGVTPSRRDEPTSDGADCVGELWRSVEGRGACKGESGSFGLGPGLDVEVVEDLDVVAQKTDRAEDDVRCVLVCDVAKALADVGAEPWVGRRALALVDDAPGVGDCGARGDGLAVARTSSG